ncbi:hypothetical protein [Chitinimonas lacunae]|uniref:Uncharacterized protein n=1 Tax=Chitinimonas lacunae TaxID=1963018 RepID=A0ABV8MJL6_9NEIS
MDGLKIVLLWGRPRSFDQAVQIQPGRWRISSRFGVSVGGPQSAAVRRSTGLGSDADSTAYALTWLGVMGRKKRKYEASAFFISQCPRLNDHVDLIISFINKTGYVSRKWFAG